MKRIVLSKKRGFTRVPDFDFYDDGNTFHFFLYRGLVPVTKFMYSAYHKDITDIFVDFRLDYLGYSRSDYEEIDTDIFNGVPKASFDMEKFREVGDAIILKFGEDVLKAKAAKYINAIPVRN